MARCAYHPDVETEMACMECGKPICPKEMALTPVGYKCPDCARPAPSQYRVVKPKQLAWAIVAGLLAGVLGGVILAYVRFGGFLLGIVWGSLTAEAVRRGSGGHRGTTVGIVAAGSIGLGWIVSGLFGGVWWVTALVAVVVALAQMAVIGRR